MKRKPASPVTPAPKPSPPERSGSTRRPIERIFAIHQAIRRGRYPNCRVIAEEIGVAQKTIQRDITFMQRDLGLPLVYDNFRHGYHYSEPVTEFPLLCHSVEDIVALFLARCALEPLEGTDLEVTLRDSFRKIAATLPGEISFRWTELDEAFSTRNASVIPSDVRLFEKIVRSVLECRELRFEYRKLDSDQWERRRLRPFHLAEFDGGWYVIGHDPEREARRTFAIQRIRAARVGKTKFLRPADFSRDQHLSGSFGVWHHPGGQGSRHRIRIHFTGWAARLVSERRWHPSQELHWIDDRERLEMVLELSSFEEILRWILSWGPQAEVIEPESLREQIQHSLNQTQQLYQPHE